MPANTGGHRVQIDVTTYPPRVMLDGRWLNCVDYSIDRVSPGSQTIKLELVVDDIVLGDAIVDDDGNPI